MLTADIRVKLDRVVCIASAHHLQYAATIAQTQPKRFVLITGEPAACGGAAIGVGVNREIGDGRSLQHQGELLDVEAILEQQRRVAEYAQVTAAARGSHAQRSDAQAERTL